MNKKSTDSNLISDEQMYSALSFCIMLVLVGIPLWWKTTEVYRVSLPYSEMETLTEHNFKIQMNIDIGTIHESRGASLIEDLNKIFERSSEFGIYISFLHMKASNKHFSTAELYNITLRQISLKKDVLGSSKSLDEIEKNINQPKLEGSLQLLELPGLSRFTPKGIILGHQRTIYFSTDAGWWCWLITLFLADNYKFFI